MTEVAPNPLFPTTIAGSLPKPPWLAAPNELWAPWRLEGDKLAAAKVTASLGAEWRQYEKFFPALAKSRIDQVSIECINSHVPMSLVSLLDGKDVLVGAIDVATDKVETPEEVAAVIMRATEYVPKKKIVACTNCGMAPMRRDIAVKKLEALAQGAALARKKFGA